MTCSSCGREIQEGVRFCTYCGGEVAQEAGSSLPLPPPPYPIPSSQAAASEDRRMALIIVGIVMGFALLIVVLAAVLMLILAHGENSSPEMAIRMTMAPMGDVTEEALAESERVIGQRLKAMGIEHYNVYYDPGRMVVEIPAMEDMERVKRIIGSTAQLQFRQVLEILRAGDPAYDSTEVTQVDPSNQEAYQALEDQESVLEKEEGGSVYKIRLGPTRLTGDIIGSAQAERDQKGDAWVVAFTVTDKSTWQFEDLTKELCIQDAPLNQLAIVLDYTIESYPVVFVPIHNGKAQIHGHFTEKEAQDMALVLNTGALPVEFTMPVTEVIGE
jgi:protein-export membrane protein SecD